MNASIRCTLELLQEVRAEVRGTVEDSAIEKLDEAIQKLEAAQRDNREKLSKHDLLNMVGIAIKLFPAIQKLIEKLTIDDIQPSSRKSPYINFKPER